MKDPDEMTDRELGDAILLANAASDDADTNLAACPSFENATKSLDCTRRCLRLICVAYRRLRTAIDEEGDGADWWKK